MAMNQRVLVWCLGSGNVDAQRSRSGPRAAAVPGALHVDTCLHLFGRRDPYFARFWRLFWTSADQPGTSSLQQFEDFLVLAEPLSLGPLLLATYICLKNSDRLRVWSRLVR